MKKDFKLIILGSDENAYGNARLLHEAFSQKALLMCSRTLRPSMYSKILEVCETPNFDKTEIFVKSLKAKLEELSLTYEKILVLPCADYYVNLLVENYDEFDGLIANKFIPQSLLQNFYRKDKFYQLCEKFGLDYPKTAVADFDNRLDIIDNIDFDFPIVVKPDNSNSFDYLHSSFDGKQKVYFFKDKASYIKLIKSMNMSTFKGKLILQEFIPGKDDTGRVINSYSNADAKMCVSCIGQPVIEEYAPSMLGNYAAIISRSDEVLYKKVKGFLEGIKYVGFSNIDMKLDKRTGKYLAFELNPRLGRSSFFVRSAGINMMEVFINDVVYSKKIPLTLSSKTALWTNVPKSTLNNYVDNKELKTECFELIKDKN